MAKKKQKEEIIKEGVCADSICKHEDYFHINTEKHFIKESRCTFAGCNCKQFKKQVSIEAQKANESEPIVDDW